MMNQICLSLISSDFNKVYYNILLCKNVYFIFMSAVHTNHLINTLTVSYHVLKYYKNNLDLFIMK